MWLIVRALALRATQPEIYESGRYIPLQASGERASHVVAYMRRHGGTFGITIAGRLWSKLGGQSGVLPLGREYWADTAIDAGPASGKLENVLTGETVTVKNGQVRLAEAFSRFPGALLVPARS
jgi:(1->4)-alpha-D-glucan 1-alpha-D-glucosylmutase